MQPDTSSSSATTRQLHVAIDGMSCGHCVAAVSRALRELPGVADAQVAIGSATVTLDPSRTPAGAVVAAIEDAGYGAHVDASPSA